MEPVAILLVGALVAGFVVGLTGLGAAMAGLSFWLYVIDPLTAVALVTLLSTASHLVTTGFIRHGILWSRLWPVLTGGLVGLPIGLLCLPYLDGEVAKLALGLFLTVYCAYGLWVRHPPVIRFGGRAADGVVGLAGGFLGGLSGISGPLPTIWAGLRGWTKDQQRGVYQPFNLAILSCATVGHAIGGRYDVVGAFVTAQIVTVGLIGSGIGFLVYRRTSDRNFRRLLLVLLLVAGLTHIVSAL